jgi:hypothetical protein
MAQPMSQRHDDATATVAGVGRRAVFSDMASKQCLPPIIHILTRPRADRPPPGVVASVTDSARPGQIELHGGRGRR